MSGMRQTERLMKSQPAPAIAEPVYGVVLVDVAVQQAEQRIRQVIKKKRGELKKLFWKPNQIYVHLGMRRIDDVLPALEGAGFNVCAVVATR
jgi:hypothetical protein